MAEKNKIIITILMRKGLVFGKFLPLHKGHLELIRFAVNQCDHLYIVVCVSQNEKIDGRTRKNWVELEINNIKNASVIIFEYDESALPNTSVASTEASAKWSQAFLELVPDVNVVFTSEPYGDYVAGFMQIEHIVFDMERKSSPVSSSQIRENPFLFWDFIPLSVRPYYVMKVFLLGTESTGKSIMAQKLAEYFQTTYVPEMARKIIEHTEACEYRHLLQIAALHAKEINERINGANKLLFIDTDVNITRSYSRFLFNKELVVDEWIREANTGDLFLFLEPDCPYIQDGTRLAFDERERLSCYHKMMLSESGIAYYSINGNNWEDRFLKATQLIKTNLID